MIKVIRTNSSNEDFIALVAKLDAYLKVTDGNEHSFYNQFNGIQSLEYVLVIYQNDTPIGCGAIKPFDAKAVEIKRMYVAPENRGTGIGSRILSELEQWATELKYAACVLETGKRQTEAITLYKKNKYLITDNYGQYIGIANSVCFRKEV